VQRNTWALSLVPVWTAKPLDVKASASASENGRLSIKRSGPSAPARPQKVVTPVPEPSISVAMVKPVLWIPLAKPGPADVLKTIVTTSLLSGWAYPARQDLPCMQVQKGRVQVAFWKRLRSIYRWRPASTCCASDPG